MSGAGIHVSPVYGGNVEPIVISDEYGEVRFYLLPFIKPVHVKHCYPDEIIESYNDACRVAVEKMGIDKGVRNVLLTHQFVTGASVCESEELSVGGSENVDASVFADFDYVALGHIHGPQNIGSNRMRYCGTPLKYSFSETEHLKSVTVAELEKKGELMLRTPPLIPRRDMRRIRGFFAEIMNGAEGRDGQNDDYIHVILTDEEDVPEAMGRLRTVYPNILKLSYDNTRTRADRLVDGASDVQRKTPLELFEELYRLQNNQPMSQEQRAFTQNLIESIWEDSL